MRCTFEFFLAGLDRFGLAGLFGFFFSFLSCVALLHFLIPSSWDGVMHEGIAFAFVAHLCSV